MSIDWNWTEKELEKAWQLINAIQDFHFDPMPEITRKRRERNV